MKIQQRLENFKKDVSLGKLSREEIFQKYLIDGIPYFFEEYISKPEMEGALKTEISLAFSVDLHEVITVGSGKLGFSLNPKNLFSEFDSLYSTTKLNKDKSDIDIAVISNSLYEGIGKRMYNYTGAYREKWRSNEYYSEERAKQFPVPICYKYFEYFTKGWFRPDFKPNGFEFCANGGYEDLKRSLYRQINRRVRIAIYQNWFYFMDYHVSNIKNLEIKLKTQAYDIR